MIKKISLVSNVFLVLVLFIAYLYYSEYNESKTNQIQTYRTTLDEYIYLSNIILEYESDFCNAEGKNVEKDLLKGEYILSMEVNNIDTLYILKPINQNIDNYYGIQYSIQNSNIREIILYKP